MKTYTILRKGDQRVSIDMSQDSATNDVKTWQLQGFEIVEEGASAPYQKEDEIRDKTREYIADHRTQPTPYSMSFLIATLIDWVGVFMLIVGVLIIIIGLFRDSGGYYYSVSFLEKLLLVAPGFYTVVVSLLLLGVGHLVRNVTHNLICNEQIRDHIISK